MTITTNDVVQEQLHIGTLKNEAHPKTQKYWQEVAQGLVVINPESIVQQLTVAAQKVQKAKAEGKEILVVSEKKMIADEVEKICTDKKVSFLNYKAPAGFLTNFETFKKRIESMNDMERFLESDAYRSLTKKEQLIYNRKLQRVFKIYKGVKNLSKKPDLVIVVDGVMLDLFVSEIKKTKGMDAIVLAWTNFSRWRDEESLVIANMHSHKSVVYILQTLLS